MSQIGKEVREIIVEPLSIPVPQREVVPETKPQREVERPAEQPVGVGK